MFGKRIRLFSLLGFEVKVDLSWLVVVALVIWSLSVGFFPRFYGNLPMATYWTMGTVGAMGLFLSIIAHELCHSLVARKYGIPIKGITLFIFGGVAEMDSEPTAANAEFMMAVVGPLSSAALGLIFYAFHILGVEQGWSVPVSGVFRYLAMVNGLLAGFNLLPAFPLDGGRILRSILWKLKNNVKWATRISSQFGSAFGIFLIVWGLFSIMLGNFISGIWYFVIGIFLQRAAAMSYQNLLTRKALEGEPVSRFMKPEPVTVSSHVSLQEFVDDYVYKYHFDMFPVVDANRLVGCVRIGDVKGIDRGRWSHETVGRIMDQCSVENTVDPDADATKALATMNRMNTSRLLVTRNNRLVGIVTLKDMLKFLALKLELDEDSGPVAGSG